MSMAYWSDVRTLAAFTRAVLNVSKNIKPQYMTGRTKDSQRPSCGIINQPHNLA